MFNYFAFSCTCYSLWSNNLVKDNLFRLGAQLIYLIKLLISCSHYFLWSHLDIMKPQSLQVKTLANMLNEAAYSCTHCVLWTHLHIIKPVSSGYEHSGGVVLSK